MFCSRHNDDVSWYREQLQSNKKLQNLVKVCARLNPQDPPRLSSRPSPPSAVCLNRE